MQRRLLLILAFSSSGSACSVRKETVDSSALDSSAHEVTCTGGTYEGRLISAYDGVDCGSVSFRVDEMGEMDGEMELVNCVDGGKFSLSWSTVISCPYSKFLMTEVQFGGGTFDIGGTWDDDLAHWVGGTDGFIGYDNWNLSWVASDSDTTM